MKRAVGILLAALCLSLGSTARALSAEEGIRPIVLDVLTETGEIGSPETIRRSILQGSYNDASGELWLEEGFSGFAVRPDTVFRLHNGSGGGQPCQMTVSACPYLPRTAEELRDVLGVEGQELEELTRQLSQHGGQVYLRNCPELVPDVRLFYDLGLVADPGETVEFTIPEAQSGGIYALFVFADYPTAMPVDPEGFWDNEASYWNVYRLYMGEGGPEEEPEQESRPVFLDVPPEAYYAEAVSWAVEAGITAGRTEDCFAPEALCSRANILTFLWRAAGSPEPEGPGRFPDLTGQEYYAQAALWARGQRLHTGKLFRGGVPCTRAETMVYFWRQAGCPAPEHPCPFADVPRNAPWANAVAWAVETGITTGVTETEFRPQGTCTRGQIVTFLHRAMTS